MEAEQNEAEQPDALESKGDSSGRSERAHKPWFVYPLLAAAICAVSSAAVTFTSMSEISPFLLACWRLQVTATLLVLPGAYSVWQMTPAERWQMTRQLPLVLSSGVLMGAHFGAWVACIENTSLTHALLAGSSPPVIIAIGSWVLRHPISRGELVGTALAALGGVLISQSAGSEKAVSIYGDCIGLLSAGFFVVYLAIGRVLRSWMPIFAYVLPVNTVAALVLCCGAVATEGAGFDTSVHGIFGYWASWSYLWRTLYLGAVPGIAGHVSFNALLKWLNPLLIALPGTTEPLIGTLLGLALGIGTLPGLFTYVGGAVLIGATILVIVSSYKREQAEKEVEAAKPISIRMASQMPEETAEKGELAVADPAEEGQALLHSPAA